MSTTMITDPMVIATTEPQPTTATAATTEVESASCECCGLTEDCTLAYIERIRERYQGKWICGLCAEAVKDEMIRATTDHDQRLISTEEAMAKHMSFCKKFESNSPPVDPTIHLISAMRQILRKSLDSPRSARSTPASPNSEKVRIRAAVLKRSESCFPTLSG